MSRRRVLPLQLLLVAIMTGVAALAIAGLLTVHGAPVARVVLAVVSALAPCTVVMVHDLAVHPRTLTRLPSGVLLAGTLVAGIAILSIPSFWVFTLVPAAAIYWLGVVLPWSLTVALARRTLAADSLSLGS